MVIRCVVPGCKYVGDSGFHSFPTDKEICDKWITKTKIQGFDAAKLPRSFRKVCKKHFRTTDYETDSTRLKKHVVPSLYLPEQFSVFGVHAKITNTPVCETNQKDNILLFSKNLVPQMKSIQPSTVQSSDNEIENNNEIIVDNIQVKTIPAGTRKMSMNNEKCDILRELKICQQRNKADEKRINILKEKLKQRGKMNDKKVLEYAKRKLTNGEMVLVRMLLRNSTKKPRGRRFTDEEKSMLLAIYKHGPKCYRHLLTNLRLPNKRTLCRYSAKMLFKAGIVPKLFEFIRDKVKDMPELSKYCIVAWDEVTVKAHLDYNYSKDKIDGFVDLANETRPNFATHTLTFMLRGISEPFKQSLAYFHTDNLLKFELAELITLVIEAIQDTGFKILGSVSDMNYINLAAIDVLGALRAGGKERKPGEIMRYKIRDQTLIHCCDAPHLIKVERNNLQVKDLIHFLPDDWRQNDFSKVNLSTIKTNPRMRLASWDDITDFYEHNKKTSINLIPNIVDEHIFTKTMKMKVSYATQVFSQTFGNAMLSYSQQSSLPFSSTGQILLFFNDVFDSINGHGCGTDLKSAVTKTSIHSKFWDYALVMISKMQFVDKDTGKVNNRSKILENFRSTIKGYKELTRMCLELKIQQINLKDLDQDMVENLFGYIRSVCQVAKTPTICNLQTGYTTAMITNLTSCHSIKSNCEKDSGSTLVYDLASRLSEDPKNQSSETFDDPNILYSVFPEKEFNFIEDEALLILSTPICRKLLQTSQCTNCKIYLQSDTDPTSVLLGPSATFVENFHKLYHRLIMVLPFFCFEPNIKQKMLSQIEDIEINNIGCTEHKDVLINKMKNYTVSFVIKMFCKRVNDILAGKITLPEKANSIEKAALIFRNKKKGIGKYMQGADY